MKKKILVLLIKYGIGLGLLAYVIWENWHPKQDNPGLGEVLQRPIHFEFLTLTGAICLVGVVLTFVRWYVLVIAQGLPFTLANTFRLGLVGLFFNTFLPGSVGGDIIKAACIAREQSRRTVAVATVLIDRGVGLCGLIWVASLLGGFFWMTGNLPALARTEEALLALEFILTGAFLLAGGSLVFWVLLGILPSRRAEIFAGRLIKIPKVGHSLAEFWRAVWMYRCRGRQIGIALVLAILGHFCFVLGYFAAARTFNGGDEIPGLGTQFLIVPPAMTIQAGFPAPGGVGGGEYAFGSFYQLTGFAFAAGVLTALTRRMIDWSLGLAGYVVYLRMRPALKAAGQKPSATPAHEILV